MPKLNRDKPYRCTKCRIAWHYISDYLLMWEELDGWGNIAIDIEKDCPICDKELGAYLDKHLLKRRQKEREKMRRSNLRKKRSKNRLT